MKMIAMDSKIPLSNFEGVSVTVVKSTCPKGKLKTYNSNKTIKVNQHYKIIPIEVSCPIAFQWNQPLFESFNPKMDFLQYHYKAISNVDGFTNKFSPPPQA